MPSSAIDKIIRVTKAQEQFWSRSHGWAPSAAADLLAEARLDRQLSFTHTLYDYLPPFPPDVAEARQILGYITLRSLCEGALKLFFSVWFNDYRKDQDAVYDRKRTLLSPEDIAFDRLIALYAKKGDFKFEPFLRRVQRRGNAIHHFCDRDIGTQSGLIADIVEFKAFLLAVNSQLPYPDDISDPD
ncbi:hypothetical protein [Methyloterricola oryzae]|uniref:hypothetical protein n=1 Tax=Methyloterricola oryzae TaxID=1495050 RepID=UPI0005EB1D8C|nr:hypothetical protein [Methyloterricola oryzae]